MIRRSKCPVMLLVYLLVALLNHLLGVVADNFNSLLKVQNVTFWPEHLSQLKEGAAQDVQYSMYVQLDNNRSWSETTNRTFGSSKIRILPTYIPMPFLLRSHCDALIAVSVPYAKTKTLVLNDIKSYFKLALKLMLFFRI